MWFRGGLLALGLLFAAQVSADITRVGSAGGWGIFYDSDGSGGCYAGATYTGGDDFAIGLAGPDREWYFAFQNPNWSSIVPGQSYQLKYLFNGRRSWKGPSTGLRNGLRSASLKESFILDIANSRSMAIYYAGNKLGAYSLRGTRVAVRAVIQCYERNVRKHDPFAKQDPFAGQGGSGGADPFAKKDPFAGSQR